MILKRVIYLCQYNGFFKYGASCLIIIMYKINIWTFFSENFSKLISFEKIFTEFCKVDEIFIIL